MKIIHYYSELFTSLLRLEAAAAEEAAAEEAERKRLEKTSTRKPGEDAWVRRGTLEIAAEEVREDEAAARARFRLVERFDIEPFSDFSAK